MRVKIYKSMGEYNSAFEHDSCSVGTIVEIEGKPSRRPIEQALIALARTIHRSGVAADGKTGDGVGIQVEIPQEFFKAEYEALSGNKATTDLGAGMFFLPRENEAARQRCQDIIVETLKAAGYDETCWRDVPVDTDVLGDIANETRPDIKQLLIPKKAGQTEQEFEHDMFVLRRAIEKQITAEELSGEGSEAFYAASMSGHSIVYKGMCLPTDLGECFPDLLDETFVSRRATFHSRFSTNTAPEWRLAHPYRYLAHNGEVNTVIGNRNALPLHAQRFADKFGEDYKTVTPLIEPGRSDSADVDAAIEFYRQAGLSLPAIKSILVPEAVYPNSGMSEDVRKMYEYIEAVYEPWDGPATLAMCDGDMVLVGGDRNGLRPVRYTITKDGLLVAGSEDGMAEIDQSTVLEKGNLEPGNMIAVDLKENKLLRDAELKQRAADELADEIKAVDKLIKIEPDGQTKRDMLERQELRDRQRLFGYTTEEVEDIIDPMARDGKEALGAMGDDTPLAVASKKQRPITDFFYQRFAQVTNPPLDSIRERAGMSLTTTLGSPYKADGSENDKPCIKLDTPVLTNGAFAAAREKMGSDVVEIDCTFDPNGGDNVLRNALDQIKAQARIAARKGQHIILSDKNAGVDRAAVPMMLAAAGVHTDLSNEGLRKQTSVNVQSAECHDVHGLACLIGTGADTVNPYLAEDTVVHNHNKGAYNKKGEPSASQDKAVGNLYKSLENGLLKIMSKMGVSPVSSYRQARLFESIGLSQDILDEFMPGVPSAGQLGGLSIAQLQKRIVVHHKKNVNRMGLQGVPLNSGGRHKVVNGGEVHADTPHIIKKLQDSIARGGDEGYALFKEYTEMISSNAEANPIRLRDFMGIDSDMEPIPLDEVESEEEIIGRFMSGAMSIGALSPAAHGVIARAMNSIGARSNSGEGGAFPEEYGSASDPTTKQIASSRFGNTAPYLVHAKELERKVAQGAKPGEGGQLMGAKVHGDIPRLRHCEDGTTLISPPPNHDEYSIEDHAQQHYDLKQINSKARTRTKLVSTTGVGTIAAGVEKSGADVIHVGDGCGGTGASPKSSLMHAGLPFEIGLSETNQVLTRNGSRENVALSTDGGLRRGRDVMFGALLGAEEFSFGTILMEATGCLLMRQCFSNKCAVGVATQDPKLIDHFPTFDNQKKTAAYAEEMIKTLMRYIARDIREQMAEMGVRKLDDLIGRTEYIKQTRGQELGLDFSKILEKPNHDGKPVISKLKKGERREIEHPKYKDFITVDQKLLNDHSDDILSGRPCEFDVDIGNENRTIGSRISGKLVETFFKSNEHEKVLPDDTVTLNLKGIAGLSLGFAAWNGMTLNVKGAANDFVGKSLSGGIITIKPTDISGINQNPKDNVILGNTSLYGATSGQLYASGRAGNRFAIRNSGATAVVDGMGVNGCNYMTGGRVVSLGEVGQNFGAGMTGGEAFIYDPNDTLQKKVHDDVRIHPMFDALARRRLKQTIEQDVKRTGSKHAQSLLDDWDNAVQHFKYVLPKDKATNEKEPPPSFVAA